MKPYVFGIIAGVAVLLIVLLLFSIALISMKFAFGTRYEKNPLLQYFTAEDFGLSAKPVSLPKGLNGFIYRKDEIPQKKELIIFCHGMGPGQVAYTTEIAYFCKHGYPVLAVDSRGCNFSEGKNLKGLYTGVQTAVAAIDFAKEQGYKDIVLVGHSWGAYSVLCASKLRKVNKVIALSAPSTPVRMMKEGAADLGVMPRFVIFLIGPFCWIANLFKFGAKGNLSAVKCTKRNGTPTLLVHGDRDTVVKLKNSVYNKAKGEHISKLLVEARAHHPYSTKNAEQLYLELETKLRKNEIVDLMKFDYKAVTEEDEEVMQNIVNFIAG